jgi:hypothetical protein
VDGFEGEDQFVGQVADLLRGDHKPADGRPGTLKVIRPRLTQPE